MKKTLSAFAVTLLCMAGWTFAGEQKKKLEDPTPRKDAILKLFVEEFVPITPGKKKFPESFMMGSEKGGHDNERPAHKVTFKYSFAIAKYEVTQELYQVVTGKNPAQFQGLRNGMDKVNWNEANEFCDKATKMLRDAKLIGANERIRLPSEAEWEYCCRAGTTTAWSFGDDVKELGKYAWFKENSAKEDPPVGKRLPNPWGLYDMHGYVWEWCLDPWHPDYKDAPSDGSAWMKLERIPPPPKDKTAMPRVLFIDRVLRGGAYPDPADKLRCAYRHHADPETRSGAIGFRCIKAEVRTISMTLGTTQFVQISTKKKFSEVRNDNPKVMSVRQIAKEPDRVIFEAVGLGETRVVLVDEDDHVEMIEVTVNSAKK